MKKKQKKEITLTQEEHNKILREISIIIIHVTDQDPQGFIHRLTSDIDTLNNETIQITERLLSNPIERQVWFIYFTKGCASGVDEWRVNHDENLIYSAHLHLTDLEYPYKEAFENLTKQVEKSTKKLFHPNDKYIESISYKKVDTYKETEGGSESEGVLRELLFKLINQELDVIEPEQLWAKLLYGDRKLTYIPNAVRRDLVNCINKALKEPHKFDLDKLEPFPINFCIGEPW